MVVDYDDDRHDDDMRACDDKCRLVSSGGSGNRWCMYVSSDLIDDQI